MYVRSLDGKEYATMLTYEIEEELSGNVTFQAVIEPNKPNLLFIYDLTEMWELVDDDEVEYKIVHVQKQGQGNTQVVQIKAIPKFYDDFDRQRVYEEYNRSLTAEAAINIIFEGSGYNPILQGSFEAVEWQGFGGGETRIEMLRRWLERYKGELGDIVGNSVYISNRVGRDTSIQYRYRLNASNIVQEIDATSLWTYAKGYADYEDSEEKESGGWENANITDDYESPLINLIGRRDAPPVKDGRIKHKSVLQNRLKNLVDESLTISVTADIHDLTKQGYPIAQAEKGDRVFLVDERIGLNEEVRIVNKKIVRDWRGRILDINLTFGSQDIVKRHQSTLKSQQQAISDILNGKIKLPFSVLDNAVIEATKALKSAQSELFFTDNGILAVDKSNPNFVTLFNSSGIGVSVDGGNTFINAITGKGINANVIYTGTMLADRIAGGVLQSLNGNTYFNLNTGELLMEDANFKLGSGAEIKFTDPNNKLSYYFNKHYSGLGVGITKDRTHAQSYVGTSSHDYLSGKPEHGFSGFFANTLGRFDDVGVGNAVYGRRLDLISAYYDSSGNLIDSYGYVFDMNSSEKSFRPKLSGEYTLGRSNNRWKEIYGTLVGKSSHNAKMNIEDLDGQQVFDYFIQMIVKSYYYKDDDYTNKYNKKVSPIIEQLDPTLENLYKATDSALDINSNLFLLVKAFQYYVNVTDARIEELEREVTG